MNRQKLLKNAKPILFNTEMVGAILDNRKTATRRIVKFKGTKNPNWTGYVQDGLNLYNGNNEVCNEKPRYKVGDILYVRETWQQVYEKEYDSEAEGYCVNIRTLIKNFDDIPKTEAGLSREYSCSLMQPRMKYFVYKASNIQFADERAGLMWRPSIHMPKEAARIFLRVTDVRTERLQYIVTGDHKTPLNINAEGLYEPCCNCTHVNGDCKDFISHNDCRLLNKFKELWDSTIKKTDLDRYGWKANPWVWVIEFERIEAE